MDDVVADLAWRGLVHQVTDQELGAKLASERFVVYHGIDATADSLHIGNLLGVLVLRRLQAAGHRPLVLLGGATTLIGDPSGKDAERPMRTTEEVRANVASLRRQLERFLVFGPGESEALLLDNADWLGEVSLTTFLRDVGKHFTVNVMITKEAVRARLEQREQGISYTEFSYMLLQAYDFLHLFESRGCRLQVGGSDQWGNITAGVELVRKKRGAEVYGLTWPLLTKADGSKFGKSEEGNVWLDSERTSPYEFFQFWMRQDDRDVVRLLKLFTDLRAGQIESLAQVHADRPESRDVHRVLAHKLTALVHGEPAATSALQASAALFGGELTGLSRGDLLEVFADAPSTSLPVTRLADGSGVVLLDLLTETGLAPSRSAARRELEQGGIYVNNVRESDGERRIAAADLLDGGYLVLRRGKKTYHLVQFA